MFRSHGGLVWRAVLTMSAGSREVADEATAEAFARLFAYREGVRDPVAWVFRTAFGVAARSWAGSGGWWPGKRRSGERMTARSCRPI